MSTTKKIDPQSEEFQTELAKTIAFTDKVVKQFEYAYNPDGGINESIQFGLTRHKLLYGKRYCPCFFPTLTKEDRICPCKPAREEEIPNDGYCHCQIFCTPEYAYTQNLMIEIDVVVHQKTRDLSEEEAAVLVKKPDIDGDELSALLTARSNGRVDFALVDTRELVEHMVRRIEGTDVLIPVTDFYTSLDKLEPYKEKPLIFYCHVGNRSKYCQNMMNSMTHLGFGHIGNFAQGIVSYDGKMTEGESKA